MFASCAVSFPCCVVSEQITNLKWETLDLIPLLAKWESWIKVALISKVILPWTVRTCSPRLHGQNGGLVHFPSNSEYPGPEDTELIIPYWKADFSGNNPIRQQSPSPRVIKVIHLYEIKIVSFGFFWEKSVMSLWKLVFITQRVTVVILDFLKCSFCPQETTGILSFSQVRKLRLWDITLPRLHN